MKPAQHPFRSLVVILAVTAFSLWLAADGQSQQPPAGENFPGVKKVLSPEQYAAAGMGKLSPEEREKLDAYLRGYFTGATERVAEQAATRAVDTAVKERKVRPPELIQTRIVGSVNGWKPDQVFLLDNGQRWKVVENGYRVFPAQVNPDVFIVRDTFGYKMAVAGGGVVRVNRVQ